MNAPVARVVTGDPFTERMAMAMWLYSIRTSRPTDAILVPTGLGENWRLVDGIRAWEASPKTRLLLVAGCNPDERTWVRPTLNWLSQPPFSLQRQEGVLIQDEARGTHRQMDWVLGQVRESGITSLAIYVSPYHLLRAYLTLLQAFKQQATPWIPLIPVPVHVSPATLVPETQADGWTMVAAELKRLVDYQEQGSVASAEQLRDYLTWLWTTPFLAHR